MISIIGVQGLGEVKPTTGLGPVLYQAFSKQGVDIQSGDILVVTSKIVSKAEGRLVLLNDVKPSKFAINIARLLGKDPKLVEIILSESRRIVRVGHGVIIVETKQGFICANAGIDQSNIPQGYVSLLPVNPDLSARRIADQIKKKGVNVGVVISDTFGRPWREGQVQVAIGLANLQPLLDYRGKMDPFDRELKVTQIAVADELASAAELIMGKLNRCPAALVKGYEYQHGEGTYRMLLRPSRTDLFR